MDVESGLMARRRTTTRAAQFFQNERCYSTDGGAQVVWKRERDPPIRTSKRVIVTSIMIDGLYRLKGLVYTVL
jgi:hypothetical protein